MIPLGKPARSRASFVVTVVGLTLVATSCGSSNASSSATTTRSSAAATTASTQAPSGTTATSGTTGPAVTIGSTSTSTQPSASTAGGSTAGPATGTPIKVMEFGLNQSAVGAYPQAVDGVQAAADAINAAGGIDGQPITVLSCNDAFDPNKEAACVQQGVDAHVVAFVGGVHPFADQTYPAAAAAGIPVIGPAVVTPGQMMNPISFPLDAGNPVGFIEMGREMVKQGGKNVVVINGDLASAKYNGNFIETGVKAAGGTVAARVNYPVPSADFAPVANQILKSHPDAVACACQSSDSARLVVALRQGGFTGPYGTTPSAISNAEMASIGSASANIFKFSADRLPDDPNGSAQFLNEMSSRPDSVARDAISELAWAATHVVADLLKGAPSKDAATLLKALNSATNVNLYGITTNINFAKAPPSADYPRIKNTTVYVYAYKDGKNVSLYPNGQDPLAG